MSPSLTPAKRSSSRSRRRKAATSSADSRTGSVTISTRGVPARLQSTWVQLSMCTLRPASSSM